MWVMYPQSANYGLSKSQPTNPYFDFIYYDIKKQLWEGSMWASKIWKEGSFTPIWNYESPDSKRPISRKS